jgi:5-methylthioadenosine/S-adenosylhomocysteine deaminase
VADIIVKRAYVVTVDPERRVIPDGAVAITGQEIVAVGTTEEVSAAHQAPEVIDAGGMLLLPGLIDGHNHPVYFVFSGGEHQLGRWPAPSRNSFFHLGGDYDELLRWAANATITPRVTAEEAYASAMAQYVHMVRSGTTCFNDGSGEHVDAIAQAAVESGIRGIVTNPVLDLGLSPDGPPGRLTPVAGTEAMLRMAEGTVEQWHGVAGDRIRAWYAPIVPMAASDELLTGLKELAERPGVGIGTHVVALESENDASVKYHGKRSLERLYDLGLFGPNLYCIHMGFPNDQEIDWVVQHDVKVAHSPSSSAFDAHGIISNRQMAKMAGRGVTISLGTDTAGVANALYRFSAAASFHKDVFKDVTVFDTPRVLEMATIEGARACLWDDRIGSIEPGKRADMILIDRSGIEWQPMREPASAFIENGSGGDVQTVIIDGKLVMRNREILTVDEERVIHEVNAAYRSMAARW